MRVAAAQVGNHIAQIGGVLTCERNERLGQPREARILPTRRCVPS